jgi:hypothetical protein
MHITPGRLNIFASSQRLITTNGGGTQLHFRQANHLSQTINGHTWASHFYIITNPERRDARYISSRNMPDSYQTPRQKKRAAKRAAAAAAATTTASAHTAHREAYRGLTENGHDSNSGRAVPTPQDPGQDSGRPSRLQPQSYHFTHPQHVPISPSANSAGY